MRTIVVIPARYASTRLPGKPLVPLCGRPLVLWVLERARLVPGVDAVLVATDDERIRDVIVEAGGEAVMTRPDHATGTDRIAEAVAHLEADVVVNIQGDEPLFDPGLIGALVDCLRGEDGIDMATAAVRMESDAVDDPSQVKVVWNSRGEALYFSRSAIPHLRDAGENPDIAYWRHVGIYAYRREFLTRMVQAPPSELEIAEKLEQLRALHLGARIRVIPAEQVGPGVDTPEDVERAEAALRAAGLA
jgi:3-deoxy-manno-octulosonate cytidylyltransferase (CMP-KDO synthetase)